METSIDEILFLKKCRLIADDPQVASFCVNWCDPTLRIDVQEEFDLEPLTDEDLEAISEGNSRISPHG